jgi:hypothetical protein
MNDKLEHLMYLSGLTAQGCWDEMDEYNRDAITKFAELIVKECANIDFRRKVGLTDYLGYEIGKVIKSHFGVEE